MVGIHPTEMLSCYRLQQSWGKVIFSEACVKNSIGGCLGLGLGGRLGVWLGGGVSRPRGEVGGLAGDI